METKINSPEHYQDTRLMDYLIDHKIGFAEGNICKYVVRWDKKDGLKDLKKAQDYLTALIAKEELRLWTAENDSRVEKAITHMKQDILELKNNESN